MQHLVEVSQAFNNVNLTQEDKVVIAQNRWTSPNLHKMYLMLDRDNIQLDREFISEISNSPSERQDWETFDQYKMRMRFRGVVKQLGNKFIKYFLNN